MYAITGISGKVGSVVARTLLQAGRQVRAVVRDPAKGRAWAGEGCDVALADMNDEAALTRAFTGAEAVFVLLPPNFDPSPGFPETRRIVAALHGALAAARPARVVCISTVGAQAKQASLLSQLGLLEQGLGDLTMPVTFLRPAWFMENAAWDVAPARESGLIPGFLQPLDRAIPMVATADVGRTAAGLLQESWEGRRVVELEGPRRYSPRDIAAGLARLLRSDVRAEAVPRETWQASFSGQGMKNPEPRMRMLDGFNEGWLSFEHTPRRGAVELDTVLRSLV
ncbi:NAD(P)H-binding protein [Polaromonas sp. CT11-55]|uniref:NAD(P)H-binding protein n=1 Tax=Polaromonas sp. CT11-55 TaxID=3243045 RepID=UPI0039A57477